MLSCDMLWCPEQCMCKKVFSSHSEVFSLEVVLVPAQSVVCVVIVFVDIRGWCCQYVFGGCMLLFT